MFPKIEKNTFIDSVKKVAKISLAGFMFAGITAFASVTKTEIINIQDIEAMTSQMERQNNFVLKPSESVNIFAYHSSHSSHASHASHASHCSSSYPCN
jgi:hypothetical protein